jgi:hypothetical protein
MARFAVAFLISCLLASPALAGERVDILDNHVTKAVNCKGHDISIKGNHVTVSATGDCGDVSVLGNHNRVVLDGVTSLQVLGNHNSVNWTRGVGGKPPRVQNLGNKNVVTRTEPGVVEGSGPASPPPSGSGEVTIPGRIGGAIAINDNGQKRTIACNGAAVAVNGNENALKFTGECGPVAVNGNENAVELEAALAIAVNGNENRVKWQRGVGKAKPPISNLGTSNRVTGP